MSSNNCENVTGQKFVKCLSREALRLIKVNHDEKTTYLDIDLPSLANVEASTTRDYHGRYLFELLQNANDAIVLAKNDPDWAKEKRYRVRIEITDSALIIANDGVPFLEKDVDSIYQWGKSSKDPNKSIGHKGIGFKSVLEITEAPEIFSQIVQFRFDRKTCHREIKKIVQRDDLKLPITRFVFPYPVSKLGKDKSLVQTFLKQEQFATVIRLPLRRDVGVERVQKRIDQDIYPILLLFLNGIDEIEVIIKGQLHLRLHKKVEPLEAEFSGQDVALFRNDKLHSRWLLFDTPKQVIDNREIINELKDQTWNRVEKVGFSVAFPLDNEGCLDVDNNLSRRLFVYFPTEVSLGLNYLIHGDFYIKSDRKYVDDSWQYNRWLVEQIAIYLQEAVVPSLVKRFPQDKRVVEILVPGENPAGFAAHLQAAICRQLRTCAFVPTLDEIPTSPNQILFTPLGAAEQADEFQEFFNVTQLSRDRRFPLPDLERTDTTAQFLSQLGAKQLEFADVFKLFDGRSLVSEPAQYSDFYDFLWRWYSNLPSFNRRYFTEALSESHCIVTDSAEWITPHERLYHAKLRQETATMPRAIQADLVHPKAYGLHGRNSSTYKLLNELDPSVRDYDAPDIIRSSIIPLFRSNRFERLKIEERAEIYRYLFDYWKPGRKGGDPDVERLKGEIQVPARPITNRRRDEWRSVTEVYLSSVWSGDDRLEKLYDGFDKIVFLYEIRGLELRADEYKEWGEFWKWLGANDMPRILKNEVEISNRDSERWNSIRTTHPHAGTALWVDYLNLVETKYGPCEKHGTDYRRLRCSITLEGFAELVESKDWWRLDLLFELLAKNWPRIRHNVYKAQIYCYRSDCPKYTRSKNISSFFDYLLRNVEWIPTRTEVDGKPNYELREPSHCWFVSHSERPIIRSLIPTPLTTLDQNEHWHFYRAIGMRSIDEALLDDWVDLLRHLSEHYPDPDIAVSSGRRKEPGALSTFSRWVIGRINNLLNQREYTTDPLSSRFPMIAWENGQLRYTNPEEPVFFADDNYHAPHWREHLPFAPLDDNWKEAARYLGLKFISKHVEESCTPGNKLEEESSRLEDRFKRARPYLLAIVNSQRPSATQDVARYLLNLQIEVVDNLVVHRALTIPPEKVIPAPEAAVYLKEERQKRVGSAGQAPRGGVLYVRQGFEENYDRLASPIAEYIDIPGLADAFVVLLDRGGKEGRLRFLATRKLNEEDVQEMRRLLGDVDVLDEPEEPEQPDDTKLTQHLINQLPRVIIEEPPTQQPPSPTLKPPPKPNPVQTLPEFPEFTLDQVKVTTVETPNGVAPKSPNNRRGGGGGGTVDWDRNQKLLDTYGKRGERLVKQLELDRLRQDCDIDNPEENVRWLREEGNNTADHDIESKDYINGELVDIYIEVKATPGNEFRFPMSKEELACAHRYKKRHRLYRVINVASATPQVFIFEDLYKLWDAGQAIIELKDTYVTLADPRKTHH